MILMVKVRKKLAVGYKATYTEEQYTISVYLKKIKTNVLFYG